MSDNLRRYRARREAFTQWYPGQPSGTVARHVITLAALISGIVGSKNTQLPHIAAHVPDGAKPESRVKRFARWVGNPTITEDVYFVPYAQVLLGHLALQTLVLLIDGSVVGRGCVALMIHVASKGRSLPLAWLVRTGKKGHCPEDLHIALVQQVHKLIPLGAQGVILGDGEFDGTTLPHTLQEYGWSDVVRTGSHLTVLWDGDSFRCETVASCIKPGTLVELRDACVTEAAYGAYSAPLVLGERVERPAVGGHESDLSRRGVSLVCQTVSNCNIFLGPEKARLPFASLTSGRPHASLAFIDGGLPRLPLDHPSGHAL